MTEAETNLGEKKKIKTQNQQKTHKNQTTKKPQTCSSMSSGTSKA